MSTTARGATELWLAWDYGTSSMRVAYRFHNPGSNHVPSVTDVRDVQFNGQPSSPQLLAFKDGRTLFGHEVENLLEAPQETGAEPALSHDDVVSFLKVSIYPNLVAEALSKEVHGQLEQLREFFRLPENADAHVIKVHALANHLREAYKYVLDQISKDMKNKSGHGSDGKLDLANMPIKIFFSVPGMWTPATNCCITAAAEIAGLSNVTLVSEPYAAASHFLADMVVRDHSLFSQGAHILILDAGAGTSDIVTFKLEDDSTSGAVTKMTVFLDWLDGKIKADRATFPGGKTKLLADLRLSAAEFKAQAAKEFKRLKEGYRGRRMNHCRISIDGNPGAAKDTIRIEIECDQKGCNHSTCDQMAAFFMPVLNQNFEMVRTRLGEDDKIEAIVVMGGFAKSTYFMSRLKDEFGDVQRIRGADSAEISGQFDKIHIQDGNESRSGYDHPVARGALLRHFEVADRDLPTDDCFMVSEDAPWNARDHGPKKDHTIVEGELHPNEDWATGLSRVIIPAGNRDVSNAVWLERLVPRGRTQQSLQIYWAAQGVQDGTRLFKKAADASVKGQTVDGIMPCGIPLDYTLPKVEELLRQYPESFKLQYPAYFVPDEQAPASDDDDAPEDSEYEETPPRARRGQTFSGPATRRKNNQLQRPAIPKPKKCSNCDNSIDASTTSSSANDICKSCDSKAKYTILTRIVVEYSAGKVLFTVQMAKPDKWNAALSEEGIGPDDVIVLQQKPFISTDFNPNPLT
ncbi:hypothetical protein CKM354_000662000 [Cercospora kikuchii]|uniref:Uncharacterized protein n=1 Tax=Cercospora kikuchii TaxID=84275 RepID=A0A9P3CHN0_9PEZI|nr:uncharacterized protein CKM354_000662000 [Cercospora kikuchii]GIZ43392.1 hypothetical protein CKM354_000662000 [Cercospora kikuchii]